MIDRIVKDVHLAPVQNELAVENKKEDHYKDTNGKINYTTKYMIYSETVIAFNQLLVECTKKFVTDNEKRIELINTIGGEFMADVEANHYIFYAVQADILNSINAFIEEYPDTAREDIFKLTVKLFNEARAIVKGNKFEDVQQEIDDHLLLMTEFMTYVSSKSPIMTNTLFSHPAVPVFHFMQPPADATEAVRPPPLA